MSFMEKSKSKENTSKEEAKNLESLVTEGKKKGFVTYDQLNKSISATKKLSVEELENAISKFSDAGIDIIEDEGEDIKLDINVNEELTVSSRSADDEDSKDVPEGGWGWFVVAGNYKPNKATIIKFSLSLFPVQHGE